MNFKSLSAGVSRRNFAFATALALAATGMLAGPAQATLPPNGEYSCSTGLSAGATPTYPTYTIESGIVSSGWYCVGAVVIPSGVIGIGSSAFVSSRITSILIPNTVTSIGDNAFYDVTSLTSITIPDSVISIGYESFAGALGLTSLTIGNSVETIGRYAFQGVTSLTSITIPDSVTTISKGAFYGASSLASLTIGNSVTSIGQQAFYRAVRLTSLTIGNSVETIGRDAFQDVNSLTSITIPNSVTSIGDGAFYGASSLTSLTIGNSVETIGDSAFREASSLRTVIIPASVTSIGIGAFEYSSVNKYYFLGDAPEVGLSAFYSYDPFRKAFIQPSAIGFQADTQAVGLGGSQVEIFWEGLIVRPAPAYLPSSLYSSWQTPLPGTVSGPNVGDTIYASAFERPLSRGLYNPDVPDLAYYREDLELFPTLEEYVHRITKEPNVATSSVDEQSTSGYRSLSEEQQLIWYESMGYIDSPYLFSWRAFMCVDAVNISGSETSTLTKPTGLTHSYASREDGDREGVFNREYSHLFRDTTYDLVTGSSPTTRTVVGINNVPRDIGDLVGGPDGFDDPERFFAIGVSEVNANCGPEKALQALQIVDSATFDPATSTYDPVTTKSLAIPSFLKLKVRDGQYEEVGTSGLTIGVTGLRGLYNAALWGLTTIADPTPPPVANQSNSDADLSTGLNESSGSTEFADVPLAISVPAIDRSKSTVFAGFAGDSSRLTTSLRQAIVKLSFGFKKVVRLECTGFTSGTSTSKFDLQLAKNRAKAACDLVRQSSKSAKRAKVLLKMQPAVGEGAKFRSVQVKIIGK